MAEGSPVTASSGPDPDRVLVLGGAAAAGLGVPNHAEGLAGRLGAGLASRTRRGATVEAVGEPGASIRAIADLVPGERLARYDAVVLIGGMAEVLSGRSGAGWRRDLGAALDHLVRSTALGCELVVATVPPPSCVGPARGRDARRADRRARVLNRVTDDVVADRGSARLARLDEHVTSSAPIADLYERWAELLAEQLAPVFDSAVELLPGHLARRVPDPEPDRLAALSRSGLTPDVVGRFEDLAHRACDLLNGEVAAVGFIDDDSHWFATTGSARTGSVPRSISPCDHTIRSRDGVVVGDLAADPRFEASPFVTEEPHLRFYAGYPIESLDGYRIGSICVLSSVPQDPDAVDLAALRNLAHEARLRL